MDLPEELDDTKVHITRLKELDWLTLYTRAITVEFTTYNANANLFTHVILLVEVPPSGGSFTLFFIESFRVYATVGSFGTLVLICCFVYLLLLLGYTWVLIKDLFLQRKKFFFSVTNLLGLVNVVLSFSCVVGYIARLGLVNKSVAKIFEAKGRLTLLLLLLTFS